MTETNIVVADKLVKTYGAKTVVNDVSFSVHTGEIFGILGPNGAGKTTTLEMIETLRKIDGGTATIDSIDVSKRPTDIRKIIGVQTQSTALYDKVTLKEQLGLLISIYNATETTPEQLLKEVQLTDKADAYPEQLSGGQRQRFTIVAALVNNPKVLFLDEPTTGLDPQARRNVWDIIKTLRDRGITIVMTSHYMEEAQLLCDRLVIMDNGSIIAEGTPKKLIDTLLATGFKKEIEVQQADLEDVFINLTGKALRD